MSQQPSKPKINPDVFENIEATETVHHASGGGGGRKGGVAQLNLTSMMDVCFLLLVFFILTSNFAPSEGILPAELPSGQGAKASDEEPPKEPLTIALRNLGGQTVNIEIVGDTTPIGQSFDDLFKVLKANEVSQGGQFTLDNPIVIKPDATVGWGHVVNAFNAAVRARYTNVNFAQPQ